MYAMEQFLQSSIVAIILTIIAVIKSDYPFLILTFCGILMFIFTIRSLYDKEFRVIIILQTVICIAFSVLSGSVIPHIILYECRINKALQILLPSSVYFIVSLLSNKISLPFILVNVAFLIVLAVLLSIAEKLVINYITAQNKISKTISVTAVNEMYEKKLNQELVIKNYLTDKNARLEERENISRNIHNSVGHSITTAIMTLDAADMLFDNSPDKAREKMNAANERIRTSLNSIRHAVRVLDSQSEFISMTDFNSELTAVTDSFVMDTMIKVHTDFSDCDSELLIPHEHTEFLTGAVQELLTNGVHHGKADVFIIGLTADSKHIRLCVSDNGKSDFSEQNAQERISSGFGLKKLISYAKKCGGSAVFDNCNGFRAQINLPLYEEDNNG